MRQVYEVVVVVVLGGVGLGVWVGPEGGEVDRFSCGGEVSDWVVVVLVGKRRDGTETRAERGLRMVRERVLGKSFLGWNRVGRVKEIRLTAIQLLKREKESLPVDVKGRSPYVPTLPLLILPPRQALHSQGLLSLIKLCWQGRLRQHLRDCGRSEQYLEG